MPAASSDGPELQQALVRQFTVARHPQQAIARAAGEAEPRFRLDAIGELVPDPRAAAAIIYNPVTGEVLWEANAQTQRPIASLTKMMTALVFLEDGPDLDETVTVAQSDVHRASITYVRPGERLRLDDLLHLLLVASDNGAARTLARVSPHGSSGFIARMNARAGELGLDNTAFADPSGLDAGNVSSAYDLSRLLTHAAADDRIAAIMRKPTHAFRTDRRSIRVRNTNRLVGEVDVQAGKTGFIRRAGFCLATLLRLPQGEQVVVVVLGAQTNAGRFWETRHLLDWLRSRAQELFYPRPQPGFE